jgi:hypothetical protein
VNKGKEDLQLKGPSALGLLGWISLRNNGNQPNMLTNC